MWPSDKRWLNWQHADGSWETHRFSLSAHSSAISSAPLLLPLPTVTRVMGMGRTARASDEPVVIGTAWAAKRHVIPAALQAS